MFFSRFVSKCISPHFLSLARLTLSTSLLFSPPCCTWWKCPTCVWRSFTPGTPWVYGALCCHGYSVGFFKSRKSMLTSEIWIWWERTLTEVTHRLCYNVSDRDSARLQGKRAYFSPAFFFCFTQRALHCFDLPQQKEIKMSVRPRHCTFRWKQYKSETILLPGIIFTQVFCQMSVPAQSRQNYRSLFSVYFFVFINQKHKNSHLI